MLRRLTFGVAWSGGATLISMAFSFGVSILSARMLGGAQFGELGLLLSTSAAYTIFAGAWLGVLSTKLVSECTAREEARIGSVVGATLSCIVALAMPLSVLLWFAAPAIAQHILEAPSLVKHLQWIALLQAFNAIDSVQLGIISGLENYRSVVLTNLARGLVALPLTVVAIHFAGLEGAVIATVISGASSVIINGLLIQQTLRGLGTSIRLDISPYTFLRMHSSLAVPSFLGAVLGAPALWLLTKQLAGQPYGYLEVGLFTAANQWKNAILFLPRKISAVSLPIMAHLPQNAKGIFSVTQSLSMLACLPAVCAMYFLADWIFSFYGKDFHNRGAVFIGVLLVAGLHSIGAGASAAIVAKGRMWSGLFTNLISTALLLGTGWLLIPRFGAQGVFLAMAASAIGGLLLTYFLLRADVGISTLARAMAAIFFLLLYALAARMFQGLGFGGTVVAGTSAIVICYTLLIDNEIRLAIQRFLKVRFWNTLA